MRGFLRKKNTGEPGNPGQFGSGPRAASGLALNAGPGAEPLVEPTPGMDARTRDMVKGLAAQGLRGRVTTVEKREHITRVYISSGDYRMDITTEDITGYLSVGVCTASNRSRFIADGNHSEQVSPELIAAEAKATLLQREMVNRAALRSQSGVQMSAMSSAWPGNPDGIDIGVTDRSGDELASASMDDEGSLRVFSDGRGVRDEAEQDRVAGKIARAMGFSQDASTREDLKAAMEDARHRAEQSEAYQVFFPGNHASKNTA